MGDGDDDGGTGGGDGDESSEDVPSGPGDCDFTYYCNHACLAEGETVGSCTHLSHDLLSDGYQDSVIFDGLLYLSLHNRIATMPQGGGPLTDLYTERGSDFIAVGDGYIFTVYYDGENSHIQRMPLSGGTPEPIHTSETSPGEFQFSDGRLYFITDVNAGFGPNSIASILPDGTDLVIHAESGEEAASEFVVSSGTLYWFGGTIFEDYLMMLAPGESEPTTISEEEYGQLLTVYDDDLYWVASNDTIRTMPLSGGTPTTFLSDFEVGFNERKFVATDKGIVAKVDVQILLIPWDGGNPIEVAHISPNFSDFNADEDYAYLFSFRDAGIFTLP